MARRSEHAPWEGRIKTALKDKRLANRWWRLNTLYFVTDEHGRKVRFRPEDRDVQVELYNNLWYLNEILKSRQHGITTFFCIYFLDACLFRSNIRAGIIAHNREDAEAFFADKVKYAYDQLDSTEIGRAIKKLRQASQDSARELKFSNNSAIRVGTSLRSATLQFLLVSEYGKICARYPEKAKEIRTGALNTVHPGQFIAIESTAEGREGHFYELDKSARDLLISGKPLTKMDFRHFFFPWWRKPEYSINPENVIIPSEMQEYFNALRADHGIDLTAGQMAWYVKKYETQQDEMKREFPSTEDEAFEAAIIGAYYATQLRKARADGRIGAVPHDPSAEVHTAWDLGINDEMAIWFFQRHGQWVDVIDYYEHSGEGLEHYAAVLRDKPYLYGQHYAPHDIKKRDLISGRTRLSRAADLGIQFTPIDRAADVVEDINEVRRLFYRLRIDEAACDRGLAALEAYRKEWNDKRGCFSRKPLHNWASNGADALRTLVHGVLSEDTMAASKANIDIYRKRVRPGLSWMAA